MAKLARSYAITSETKKLANCYDLILSSVLLLGAAATANDQSHTLYKITR